VIRRVPAGAFFALFAVSGFAGLIYESIWSHYLKLFLGHAAYAQTLVLAIFMGGMALGAWLVGHFTGRIRDLLLGYAIAELGIGLLAVAFDAVFRASTGWAFDTVLPALGGGFGVDAFKWGLASLLILPASILLGTTFPLMSGAVIRLYPQGSGGTLAMLYFTNSLGASAGVLASGFLLVGHLGLPGTILTAGLLNIVLGVAVWFMARWIPKPALVPAQAVARDAPQARVAGAILAVAFATGAATFIYEIAWIRMLTLGLGASTHSFEVMLAAFILGMAIGALLLRSRIGRIRNDVAWLAVLLVAKAVFAAYAIGIYDRALDAVVWLLGAASKTPAGYGFVTAGGLAVSMLVMFPAALCAGMTLPLATQALLARGRGEAAIGKVYAANTAGCILGAVFATHVGMEALGIRGLTVAGAALDLAMAALVAMVAFPAARRRTALAGVLVFALGGVATAWFADLDRLRMSSGVFRTGHFLDPATASVPFYRDGKTATVSVTAERSMLSLRTNGKPDAGVQMRDGARPAQDEATMVLLGALPLVLHPQATRAAVIGFGSGMSSHVMLASPKLETLDTIEIEPAMVEAARLFRPRNERAYADPRSRVSIEDAKTFFAARGARYDVIVSEPSNPWVSGVSTLFSDEFYAQSRRHLRDDGLFVQWLQAYEINLELAATVFAALGRNFSDYAVYTSNGSDLVIVAVPKGRVPALKADLAPELARELDRVGYRSVRDVAASRVASLATLQPLLGGGVPNSDYFPVLDQRAPLSRYMGESILELAWLPLDYVPLVAMVEGDAVRASRATLVRDVSPLFPLRSYGDLAAEAAGLFLEGRVSVPGGLDASSRATFLLAHAGLQQCGIATGDWFAALDELFVLVVPRLSREEIAFALEAVERSACSRKLSGDQRLQLALHRAVSERDASAMRALATKLLDAPSGRSDAETLRFTLVAMMGTLATQPGPEALAIWRSHAARLPAKVTGRIMARAVRAHAVRSASQAGR
jgi:spermidine synthase